MTPRPYSFFPQAGALWEDLYVNNFVDLGGGGTPQDYDCTGYTYAGHAGHDSDIAGFREHAIGVPVFAALDGTVVSAHDGEPDMNTVIGNQQANFVILDHGGTQRSSYWHLKRGSVAVAVGQSVTAGTQLGLTGSSGSSTWPHLHFQSEIGGLPYEPSAGGCRPGPSYWVRQTPIRRETYVRSVVFANEAFTGAAALPWDQVTRTGAFVVGTTSFVRLQVGNVPANATITIQYRRPDSSVASSFSHTTAGVRSGWFWYQFTGVLNTVGAWTMTYSVNGATVASAPFQVVSSPAQLVNRSPNPIGLTFEPASLTAADAPFCRVQTSLYLRDPDYDLVRYRYEWRINGTLVRTIVSAALSDAIPRQIARDGDRLECTVMPLDEQSQGTAVTAVRRLGLQLRRDADFDGDGKTDIAVYRPATGTWWILQSSTNFTTSLAPQWGGSTDIPVPGDYDGDGTTDVAVYHRATGSWWVLKSSTNFTTYLAYQWGDSTAIPVAGDYDGDGKTDIAVYHPATATWWVLRSSTTFTTYLTYQWGDSTVVPVAGDYDGDAVTDITVYHPASGTWWVLKSSSNFTAYVAFQWGGSTDVPMAGDYDGDGVTDIAVYHPANGTWWVLKSSSNFTTHVVFQWGLSTDIPAAGDYDGDGTSDIAVYRPAFGAWWVLKSTTNFTAYAAYHWGASTDIPAPAPTTLFNH